MPAKPICANQPCSERSQSNSGSRCAAKSSATATQKTAMIFQSSEFFTRELNRHFAWNCAAAQSSARFARHFTLKNNHAVILSAAKDLTSHDRCAVQKSTPHHSL